MSYHYKLVTQLTPVRECNIVHPSYIDEPGPFFLDLGSEAAEVDASSTYRSLKSWDGGEGPSYFTQHISGCIPVAIYCPDPKHLAMVHFGACHAGRQETYDAMFGPIPEEKWSSVFALAVMSKADGAWFGKSQFEDLVLPQLRTHKVPDENVVFYHDTTEDYLAVALRSDGYFGTPRSMRKNLAK